MKNAPKKPLEAKVEHVQKTVNKDAKIVGDTSRGIIAAIGKWRDASSKEERIFTFLGILLLIIGSYLLRQMIIGVVFVVLGFSLATGYFIRKRR